MCSADWSDRSRRLAGVDQALGDGRARPPGELLDQLRERLGRLELNHPSAYPQRAHAAARDAGEPDGFPDAEDSHLGELTDESQIAAEAGSGVTGAIADTDVADWGSAGAEAGRAGDRPLLSPGRPGHGDPYRPWFMDGEPGTPWFAE
jgi:hypothetical protein